MNREEQIIKLEQTKAEIERFKSELDEKLSRSEIPKLEYDIVMQEKLCGKDKPEVMQYIDGQISLLRAEEDEYHHVRARKTKLIAGGVAIAIIIMVALSGIMMPNHNTPSGYVTKSVVESQSYNITFDQYTEAQLNISSITSLGITGTLTGERATVKLRIADTDYLVGEIINSMTTSTIREYALKTDKSVYALEEPIQINITPEIEERSIYISHNNNSDLIGNTSYIAPETGEYSVIVLITTLNGTVRLETNFTVLEIVLEGTPQVDNTVTQSISEPAQQGNATISFENICNQTCDFSQTNNPILIVDTAQNSTLTITNIIVHQNKENQPPVQTKTLPDVTIAPGQEATINLDEYFHDPDDTTLYYDTNTIPEINSTTNQNILTISSSNLGIHQMYIYASDGSEMITSNTFQITVTESQTTPVTNETTQPNNESTTTPATNETGGTINQTNETAPIITNDPCSNPDPNQRPLTCIQEINSTYFKPEEIIINNKEGMPVARFTPIGNLLIKGEVIEHSAGAPSAGDYQLGYIDDNGDYAPTIWIDSVTGSLHLKGNLTEANGNIPISEGLSALANQRGIILALFDRQTGDMTVRGNVIPYRRDVTQ